MCLYSSYNRQFHPPPFLLDIFKIGEHCTAEAKQHLVKYNSSITIKATHLSVVVVVQGGVSLSL